MKTWAFFREGRLLLRVEAFFDVDSSLPTVLYGGLMAFGSSWGIADFLPALIPRFYNGNTYVASSFSILDLMSSLQVFTKYISLILFGRGQHCWPCLTLSLISQIKKPAKASNKVALSSQPYELSSKCIILHLTPFPGGLVNRQLYLGFWKFN